MGLLLKRPNWVKLELKGEGVSISIHRKKEKCLKYARYVVTNSYHGTLFAAIFQKNFYTVLEDTGQGNISFRMREFLSDVGLEDRIFNSVPENLDPDIRTHFEEAAVKIDEYKNAALNYLRTNLDMAYEKHI